MQAVSHHQLSLPHVHWCKFASSWHLVRNNNSISQLGLISERWKKWWIKEQFIRISQKCNLWECNVSAGVLTHFCFPEAKQYSKTWKSHVLPAPEKEQDSKATPSMHANAGSSPSPMLAHFQSCGHHKLCHQSRSQVLSHWSSGIHMAMLVAAIKDMAHQGMLYWGHGLKHCSGTGYAVRSPVFYSHQSQ